MRIFYASIGSPVPDLSLLWHNNLYLPLKDLGHEVVEFDYDLRETCVYLDTSNPDFQPFIARNRPKVSAELRRQVKAAHAQRPIDLFFTYFYDACVLPETIDEIRGMGIPTVNWYCNGSYQLPLVSQISPHYDWCLVPEKFRLQDYRDMGAHPLYCQEAANPNIYKPYDVPVIYDVTFVGQAYGDRPAYIQYVREQGIDIRVWGLGWRPQPPPAWKARLQHAGRRLLTPAGRTSLGQSLRRKLDGPAAAPPVPAPDAQAAPPAPEPDASEPAVPVSALDPAILGPMLSDKEMIQMYSRSKINLGFSSCGDTHLSERILQVRLRDFEVPMSGGFYMVEYMEELEEFFEIDREIVCYTGREDMVEKIHYYLAHDGEREKIRRAGYERCLRDHSWQKRLETAFAQMHLAPAVLL